MLENGGSNHTIKSVAFQRQLPHVCAINRYFEFFGTDSRIFHTEINADVLIGSGGRMSVDKMLAASDADLKDEL